MRVDLPFCNLITCRYQFDGNCMNKNKYDTCEYTEAAENLNLLQEEMDRPVKTLWELTTQFCCLTECKNCPVCIHKFEKRTEYEKTCLHTPCVDNLYKWIIEQVMEMK